MLFAHCERRDDSRAVCTAGNSRATSTPIMAMTTSSSTSVKPFLTREDMRDSLAGRRQGTGVTGQRTGDSTNHSLTHHSLLCHDVKVEFERAFFLDLDLMLTLAVPLCGDFRFRRWRQRIAGHVTGGRRRRGDKIFDGHAILAGDNALRRGDGVLAAHNSSTTLQPAFKQRMKFDVS